MGLPEHPPSNHCCIGTTPYFRENPQDQLPSWLSLELFFRLKVNPTLTGGCPVWVAGTGIGSSRVEARVDYCSAGQGWASFILSPPFLLAPSLITAASSLSPHLFLLQQHLSVVQMLMAPLFFSTLIFLPHFLFLCAIACTTWRAVPKYFSRVFCVSLGSFPIVCSCNWGHKLQWALNVTLQSLTNI